MFLLIPAHPGSPGQRAVNDCVCVHPLLTLEQRGHFPFMLALSNYVILEQNLRPGVTDNQYF